jgi:predicted dehydrogenase
MGRVIRVGVCGWGYWGPELARNIADTPGFSLVAVADERAERRDLARRRYKVDVFARMDIFLASVDAVVITTPTSTHAELVEAALYADKHVLVAKPLAATVRDAERLRDIAKDRGLTLLVDHTFVYTGAVRRMKDEIANLGDLFYYDSVRVNLGIVRSDCDVIWDLAPHDISILLYLLGDIPGDVAVDAMSHLGSGVADMAYVTMTFPKQVIAHLHLNWLSPVKVRTTIIGGSEKTIVYDDMEPSEKVRIYGSNARLLVGEEHARSLRVDYRLGDCFAPHLDRHEALAVECHHFRDCIRGAAEPISGADMGVDVVRVLEALDRAKESGAWVAL